MDNVKPKRLENIAFIKTIMMIVIVLYHSFCFFGGTWFTPVEPAQNAEYLYDIAKWMNTFHIQTFAMASGFLFYYLLGRRSGSHLQNILKRAKRLMIPYLFACIFWVVPIGWYFFHFSASEIINNYVLMVKPSQLWFLVMLFMVFLFFEFFGERFKFTTKRLIIVFLATTIFGRLLGYLNVDVFQISKSVQYILYFYLGGYIFYHKEKISLKQTWIMAVLALIFYAGMCVAELSNNSIVYYGVTLVRPIVSILEVSCIYYIFTRLVNSGKVKLKSKLYKAFEANSFGIYLFHQQIIYFTIMWFNGVVPPIVQALLSFVIATCLSLMMSLILRRWKITRTMFGL